MSALLIVLACLLICPLMMGLMMLFMRKGHGESHTEHRNPAADVKNEPD